MRSNQNEIIFFYNFIAFVFLKDRQHLDTVAADLVLDQFPHNIYPEPIIEFINWLRKRP